jgi:hypothetical protein
VNDAKNEKINIQNSTGYNPNCFACQIRKSGKQNRLPLFYQSSGYFPLSAIWLVWVGFAREY